MSRRPVEAVRDLQARREALRRYATAHDKFSEAEQLYAGAGLVDESQLAHEYALRILLAYDRENVNPPPTGLATPYYYDPHDRGTP